MIEKIKNFAKYLFQFFSEDIWNVDTNGVSFLKRIVYNILKSFVLTYRRIDFGLTSTRASALTYSTLLSIVPMLAILFAIASGFGLLDIVENELLNYFEGQREVLEKGMVFINNSLQYAQGGVFVGIGIVMLLYTVISLLSSIEDIFNKIWRVKNGRSYYRQFTDYFALMLIAPVFLVCNAGISIVMNTALQFQIIGLVISPVLKILPYGLTIFLFTFMYIYIPNKKNKIYECLVCWNNCRYRISDI